MKRMTVKDIAKLSGVSLGAVNMALTGKPSISKKTRIKILETAKRIGYRPNRIAQSLARKPIVIGIVIPEAWPEYIGYLEKGMHNALEKLHDFNVFGSFHKLPGNFYREKTREVLHSLARKKVDAVIMCPTYGSGLEDHIDILYKKNIPVVLLVSDLSDGYHLTSIRVNGNLSGRLAAELMKYLVPKDESVAVFIGIKEFTDHRDKLAGFVKEVRSMPFKISRVLEAQDDPHIAYNLTRKLVKDQPDLGGIYIASANSVAVCKCLVDCGLAGKIKVITTDVFPELKYYVDKDIIQCTIYQNQLKQGELAVNTIYKYIVEKVKPEPSILVNPQLVFKNNFAYYLKIMESDNSSE